MNLVVENISNDQAKNNSLYMSSQLAKDASKLVNIRIKNKIFKCCFLDNMDRNKIGMSKNNRTFIGTDVGMSVTVEPVSQEY